MSSSCRTITLPRQFSGGAPHLGLFGGQHLDGAAIDHYYVELYRGLALSPAYSMLFGQILRGIATTPGKVMIFCAAGKDRTGILMAIIGRILGLTPDDIMADYLVSNEDVSLQSLAPVVDANARKSTGQILTPDLIRRILGASPDYLDTAFREIGERFGSFDGYLDSIDVTANHRDAIRQALTI